MEVFVGGECEWVEQFVRILKEIYVAEIGVFVGVFEVQDRLSRFIHRWGGCAEAQGLLISESSKDEALARK